MTQENYIVDTQLPLELDFKALKAAGFAYIQKHSGTEWTNLNPSDPGVTILEQLCYAFTELGYCANFSMKDILTQKNGDLTIDDQFYLPQDILTTSPVTINDYTKYVIDQIASVKNVIITPISLNFPFVVGVYEVYLLLDPNYEDPSVENAPIEDTFFLLNSSRNVGELFLQPKVLVEKQYTIKGNLVLKSGYDLNTTLPKMIQAINDHIFPDVTQTGYDKLKAEGETINEIFNGPSLENGWISTESIQPKKDIIQAFEITKLIQDIEGVQSVSNIQFTYQNITSRTAICQPDEILSFDFSSSLVKSGNLSNFQISTQGKQLNAAINTSLIDELSNMQQSNSQINEVAAVQIAPKLPSGKFRDITSYYSIQNTFPEAYAVGLNATNDNTPAYQVAQSRQLKGYLSLFDQMLSNQFAQLANINKLFSFKNAITGSPAELEHYNNIKTPEEKTNPKYPVPFKVFSPTYFYQSLYTSVPNVEPLLRNNTIFNFGPVSESETALAYRNWLSYQDDPYNSYMYGLLVFSENDAVNLQRRNDLLDHLLARHGESPLIIDTLIYGTVYSGDMLKDRVIIKSLYLQNLAILSYNRTKAYNSIGAAKLNTYIVEITPTLIESLSKTKSKEILVSIEDQLNSLPSVTSQDLENARATYRSQKLFQDILTKTYKKDGVFDTDRINKDAAIQTKDLLNYTTISLKLSMLLTLQPFYINFIQTVLEYDADTTSQEALSLLYTQSEMALWLIAERKGFIAIETNILLQSGIFQFYIKENTLSNTYYRLNTILNYNDFTFLSAQVGQMDSPDIDTFLQDINSAYTLTKIESSEVADATFLPTENPAYEWTANVSWNNENAMYITDEFLEHTLFWIFPNYIPEINTSDWQQRLSYFKESQLPIQISALDLYGSSDELKTLIPQYVSWFNANIYNAKTTTTDPKLALYAASLITTIFQISKNEPIIDA